MSVIQAIETQGAASPIDGLTRVAVLVVAPDGWRCYEAFHALRLTHWTDDKAAAASWTVRHGNKIPPEDARRYFHITDDMEFVP